MNSVNQYAEAVVRTFSPEAIFLYGSYANGNARQDSDIDIAVMFEQYNDSLLDGLQGLYKLRRNIDDRIEPVLIEAHQDKSGFAKHIRQTGYLIYSKES